MNKNFKLIIEYDGRNFFGWQRQKDVKTIQGDIENALRLILNQEIKITGSGRTDAGVHALGQVANFHADTHILPHRIKAALNSLLKGPVVIRDCHLVASSFHARYSAVSKEYHYFILNRQDPFAIGRMYHWHVRPPLDVGAMTRCCQSITGIFDFKSFENTGSPRSSTLRQVYESNITPLDHDLIVFKIIANGFLKNMVRNLVGTIVLAGLNKISHETFVQILKATDRTLAGPTAPAQGLFLKKVNYS